MSSSWKLDRTRRVHSYSSPNYAALEPSGQGVVLACDKPVKFVFDSLKPVKEPTIEEAKEDAGEYS